MSGRYETALGCHVSRGMVGAPSTQLSRPMRDWPCIIERALILLTWAAMAYGIATWNLWVWAPALIANAAVWFGALNPLWRRFGW